MPGQSTTKRGSSSKERMSRSRDKYSDSPPGSYPPGRTRAVSATTDRTVRPSSASRSSRSSRGYKPEDLKHDGDTAMGTIEPSDLRNLIHLAEELQKIDLSHALALYKGLMKQTKNDEQLVSEEKYLERQRQMKSTRDQETIDGLQEQFNTLLNEKERVEEENKKLKSRNKDIDQIQDQFQKVEKEMKTYKADLLVKEEELKQARKEKDNASMEKNDALTRLSKEMGQKLTDNNPSIADLSDPNRALKLAEKYNELYDNEWTDAMEILGVTEKNETINVQILLETLKKCYRFCADLAEKQMESLEMVLVHPNDVKPKPASDKSKKLNIPKSIHKQLKDCRKEMSTTTIDSIKQERLTDKLGSIARKIPNFISKCMEICWFMCVLDPPVVLGDEASVGTTFDTNIYKPYTNSGTVVAYNVWPPLLLHQNGSLLVKGIVQPVKVAKKKTMAERMDVNGVRESNAMKSRPDYITTHSVKGSDRLTESLGYGHDDAGYDPFKDAYGTQEPVTTKSDKRYDDNVTGAVGYDDYKHKFDWRDPVSKSRHIQTDTEWKDHNPYDSSRTPSRMAVTRYGTESHYAHVRDRVEGNRRNIGDYEYQTRTTNYKQQMVSPERKYFIHEGVTYVEMGNRYMRYEQYLRLYGTHSESHA